MLVTFLGPKIIGNAPLLLWFQHQHLNNANVNFLVLSYIVDP